MIWKWILMKGQEMKITIENVGDLSVIVAHYKAIPILLNFIKENGGYDALEQWDKERNIKLENLRITIET